MAATLPPIPSNKGLTPDQELAQWRAWRQQVESSGPDWVNALTPEQSRYYNGPSPRPNDPRFSGPDSIYGSQYFTPAAGNLFINDQTHYDLASGQVQKNKGFWDLPESYGILAAGTGLTAPYVVPALASTLGGEGGTAASAGTTAGAAGAGGGSTGIWSGILGGIKGFASDPKNWLSLASDLTSNAAGRAAGRAQEGALNLGQDRNAIALYQALLDNTRAENQFALGRGALANANAATDLNQRQFTLQAPSQRAANAVRGDILARAQDATVSGVSPNIPVPTINGGLRPSMFSPATRDLGNIMSTQARDQQAKGDTFAPLPDLPTWQTPPAPPTLLGTPQANGVDTALTTGGNLLNLGGTFLDYLKKYRGGQPTGSISDTTTGVYT